MGAQPIHILMPMLLATEEEIWHHCVQVNQKTNVKEKNVSKKNVVKSYLYQRVQELKTYVMVIIVLVYNFLKLKLRLKQMQNVRSIVDVKSVNVAKPKIHAAVETNRMHCVVLTKVLK